MAALRDRTINEQSRYIEGIYAPFLLRIDVVKRLAGNIVRPDKLVDTPEDSPLCFRPLEPRLGSGLDIVGKNTRPSLRQRKYS